MVTSHLRRNAVAYLALIFALSTGTAAYAAGLANGSVTTKKLARNAVTSAKIKNDSVRSADLEVGVVPFDGFVSVKSHLPMDPNPAPDLPGMFMQMVTVPRAAPTYLRFFATRVGISCLSGDGYVALSIDGEPVSGTRIEVEPVSNAAPVEVVAITPTTAGQHELSIDGDCPDDFQNGVTGLSGGSWTVMLTAS